MTYVQRRESLLGWSTRLDDQEMLRLFQDSAFLFFCGAKTCYALGRFIVDVSRLHIDTPHSVGRLWTRDRLFSDTTTCRSTKFGRGRHP
jgi:hypothetical protein